MSKIVTGYIVCVLLPLFLAAGTVRAESPAPVYTLEVLDQKPHDPDIYTQGLFFYNGILYESGGLYGRSVFRALEFGEGAPALKKSVRLPGDVFAEGAAEAGGEIYLLSWENGRGWMLDPESLETKREFVYEGEGWGLTFDGETLWRSDGSAFLHRHRPGDFAEIGAPVAVRDGGEPVPMLNELEWDPRSGLILANIYLSERVVAIDPKSGQVRFSLDMSGLHKNDNWAGMPAWASREEAVLNGLALAPDGQSLWLTGKLWNRLYQAPWPPK